MHAYKDPTKGDTIFLFCDNAEVTLQKRGVRSVEARQIGRHPAFASFMEKATANLDAASLKLELAKAQRRSSALIKRYASAHKRADAQHSKVMTAFINKHYRKHLKTYKRIAMAKGTSVVTYTPAP